MRAEGADAHVRNCDEQCGSFRAEVIKLTNYLTDTYDGSVSLNEFLVQFQLIARANR